MCQQNSIVFKINLYVSSYRERQDSDGQMKELQDQLEAEQYFSVCNCGGIFIPFLKSNTNILHLLLVLGAILDRWKGHYLS